MSKTTLGQYYTTNYEYILEGFDKPTCKIIEPFAGKGDLLKWLDHDNWEAWDIDPKEDGVKKRDTLIDPPDYSNAWILTNPPYLARNKSVDKTLYDKYNTNDLYKCFILSLLHQPKGCLGGLIIIPVGFFFAIDSNCRDAFMTQYRITKVKYFEESVFDDTSTSVVAMSFVACSPMTEQKVVWEYRPSGIQREHILKKEQNWVVGGDIYDLETHPDVRIYRYIGGRSDHNDDVSHLTLHAIDGGKDSNRIRIEYNPDFIFQGKQTSRATATLCFKGIKLSEEEQKNLANVFNEFLENKRSEYHNMFLPQYRESRNYARKRIPFELVYNIVSNLLLNHSKKLNSSPT